MKAAAFREDSVTSALQSAAEMLGETPSSRFPSMALWRAAQKDDFPSGGVPVAQVRKVQDDVGALRSKILRDAEHSEFFEKLVSFVLGVGVTILVVSSLIVLFSSGHWTLEVLAVWIPSFIGALHSYSSQKQIAHRKTTSRRFISELELIQDQLLQIVSRRVVIDDQSEEKQELVDCLKTLCLMAGRYGQEELRFAMADSPNVPV